MTLKMTSAQVFETLVTENSCFSQNCSHLDDHTEQTADTTGLKPHIYFFEIAFRAQKVVSTSDCFAFFRVTYGWKTSLPLFSFHIFRACLMYMCKTLMPGTADTKTKKSR